ncbi:hypothetical protein AAFC00_005714 [Neodothiora populina]|uniref:Uncharacterized protein n=1 Tax=Neodothiora populina TaxID=2781224 RepID=A0ABR3P6W7_9PEZI
MQLKWNIGLIATAFVIPHLYSRVQLIRGLQKNAPEVIEGLSAFPSHEVKYVGQLRNCEDVILLDESDGWALLSCDAGRDHWNTVMGIFRNGSHTQGVLHLYNYASPKATPIPLSLLDFPQARVDFHLWASSTMLPRERSM